MLASYPHLHPIRAFMRAAPEPPPAVSQSAAADSENTGVLSLVEGDGGVGSRVRGVQRSLVFLVPSPSGREGDLFMQVGARAVAIYDYQLDMRRVS